MLNVFFIFLIDSLVSRKVTDGIDGLPFVIGTLTFLHQFHQDQKTNFLAYMGQYIKSAVEVIQ